MNPDAAPRGQDLLREMGGPAWRPYDAIPPQKPGWRWRIARIFVRMIVRNPLRVARSKFLRRAFAVAFYEVLFVISGDGDDGMADASADLRVLVKVGRMHGPWRARGRVGAGQMTGLDEEAAEALSN